MKIEHALVEDIAEILALYRACVNTPYCLWTQEYPAMENVLDDMGLHSLYVIRGEQGGILAVASLGEFGDIAEDGWPMLHRPCELARLGVLPEAQGKGIAGQMLRLLIEEARRRGYDGIRLLAGVNHIIAQRLYNQAGFLPFGTCDYFGGKYIRYQINLA